MARLKPSTALIIVAAGLFSLKAPARAADFGPASIGYSTDSRNVVYDLSAGTLQILPGSAFTYSGGNDSYFSGLTDNSVGSAFNFSGLIDFSTTVGALRPVSLPNLISIVAPQSGTYTFSADAVGTAALSSSTQNGDQLTLYLEGTMGGGNDNETPTATDVVLNLTNLPGFGGTLSGTVFNPPAGSDPFATAVTSTPVPEPASWTLLITGALAVLGWRRATRLAPFPGR